MPRWLYTGECEKRFAKDFRKGVDQDAVRTPQQVALTNSFLICSDSCLIRNSTSPPQSSTFGPDQPGAGGARLLRPGLTRWRRLGRRCSRSARVLRSRLPGTRGRRRVDATYLPAHGPGTICLCGAKTLQDGPRYSLITGLLLTTVAPLSH